MDVKVPKSKEEIQKIIDSIEPSADIDAEAFKYWIHCNRCYEIYPKKRVPMYLLSCYHILCANCVGKDTTTSPSSELKLNETIKKYDIYKCAICSKVARARTLGNDMPRHLKELFHPHPWVNDVPTARILKFQIKHRTHILNGIDTIEKKIMKREKVALELGEELQRAKDELRKLMHENMKLERTVRPLLSIYKQKRAMRALDRNKLSRQCFRNNGINSLHSVGGSEAHTAQLAAGTAARQNFKFTTSTLNQSFSHKGDDMTNVSMPQGNSNITSFMQSKPNCSFRL